MLKWIPWGFAMASACFLLNVFFRDLILRASFSRHYTWNQIYLLTQVTNTFPNVGRKIYLPQKVMEPRTTKKSLTVGFWCKTKLSRFHHGAHEMWSHKQTNKQTHQLSNWNIGNRNGWIRLLTVSTSSRFLAWAPFRNRKYRLVKNWGFLLFLRNSKKEQLDRTSLATL